MTFTVTPIPGKAPDRKHLRGAFLIRLADGYSRPVMVYAETNAVQAVKPARDGVWTQFIEAEAPSGDRAYEVVDDPAASGGKCALVAGSAKDAPWNTGFGFRRMAPTSCWCGFARRNR